MHSVPVWQFLTQGVSESTDRWCEIVCVKVKMLPSNAPYNHFSKVCNYPVQGTVRRNLCMLNSQQQPAGQCVQLQTNKVGHYIVHVLCVCESENAAVKCSIQSFFKSLQLSSARYSEKELVHAEFSTTTRWAMCPASNKQGWTLHCSRLMCV